MANQSYSLDRQIGFLLRKANQRHRALFNRHVRRRVMPTQWAAIAKLYEVGPLSQNQLGRMTAMDSATIAGVVGRLTDKGLVATEPNEDDARLSIVSLTMDGEELMEELLPAVRAATQATVGDLSEEEQRLLIELLVRVADSSRDTRT